MADKGQYLNLKPNVPNWAIYPLVGPYTREYRIGELAPSQFGGLSYQIQENKGNHVYVIQTESFGKVAIWAGDQDSTFTSSPSYTNGSSTPTGGTGRYVNLKPHVPNWSIYNPNGPYVTASRIGTLAPSQFGGLSYEIRGEKGNNIYLIQTESFGLVGLWAGDNDSTFTSAPLYLDPINGGKGGGTAAGTGEYLNLHPHVSSWSIYNPNGPYVTASRIGTLAPSQFGGLSYAIIGKVMANVYLIQTESFGKVAIWAGDSDGSITGSPLYEAGSYTGGSSSSSGTYLNLSPRVPSWSIYNVNGPYLTANRIGTLAPSQFGGLSYRILESKKNDVYIIQTESFGKVAIWAGDSDSTFTTYAVYSGATATPPSGGIMGGIDFGTVPVTIQSRSQWGASPVQWGGMDGTLGKGTVKYLVVHHTAGTQPQVGSDYAVMRGIQNYHQSLGWGDIGYHFCIGQQGTVMEGRSLPYVGAHVGKPHNFDSIGVSMFGDFSYVKPEDVQLKKLVSLLAALCREYNVSPNNILGHRDMDSNYGATSCPGDYFYNVTNGLKEIRQKVKNQLLLDSSLNIEEKKVELMKKIQNYFVDISFFKNIPFNVNMWEQEKTFSISSNIKMKVKLSLETQSDSPIANLFSINITKPQIDLEGPYFDLIKKNKIDNVEFYNMKEAMERIAGKLEGKGNVVLSVGAKDSKILYNYVVNFNSLSLSDGSSLGSSCRITLEIDNKTFVTPTPEKKPVSNIEFKLQVEQALETAKISTMTALVIIGLAAVAPIAATIGTVGGVSGVIAISAGALILAKNNK